MDTPSLTLDAVHLHSQELTKKKKLVEAANLYTTWLNTNVHRRSSSNQNKIDPEEIAVAYNNRGHLKYLRVDFEGAVRDYNEGLKYNSLLPCLYYNRGTIMYRMGYFDKAAEDMLVATRLSPSCQEFQVAFQRTKDQLSTLLGTGSEDYQHFLSPQKSMPNEQNDLLPPASVEDAEEIEEDETLPDELKTDTFDKQAKSNSIHLNPEGNGQPSLRDHNENQLKSNSQIEKNRPKLSKVLNS